MYSAWIQNVAMKKSTSAIVLNRDPARRVQIQRHNNAAAVQAVSAARAPERNFDGNVDGGAGSQTQQLVPAIARHEPL
jgi:hypothetical protein